MTIHASLRGALSGFTITLGVLVLVACRASGDAPASTKAASPAPAQAAASVLIDSNSSALTLVPDSSQVCMVNDQFMGRTQIPVTVEGKTYYGCCAMCKARLQSDAAIRTALDPVSHTPVDKASAVIGKTAKGSALYFASLENFHAYAHRSQTQ